MEGSNKYDFLSSINEFVERKEIPISVRSRRSNHQYLNKLEFDHDSTEKYASFLSKKILGKEKITKLGEVQNFEGA